MAAKSMVQVQVLLMLLLLVATCAGPARVLLYVLRQRRRWHLHWLAVLPVVGLGDGAPAGAAGRRGAPAAALTAAADAAVQAATAAGEPGRLTRLRCSAAREAGRQAGNSSLFF